MAGRRPKPDALKRLAGNPGKRQLDNNAADPVADTGYAPRWLTGEARKEWGRLVPELRRLGLFAIVDRMAMAAYCTNYARWREAEEALEQHGSLTYVTPTGFLRERPEVGIAREAMAAMRTFMMEFGMTPAARTKVHPKPQQQELSEFERFMQQAQQGGEPGEVVNG